jgi:dihydrolipoamide dehydrogenase
MADADTQVAVIGAGPGGYAAAFLAADLGLRVTLIDPEPNPGGVCLYRGCIPSKALLHIAAQIFEARSARERGVVFGKPKVNISRLREWKNEVVDKLTSGLGQLVKQRRIQYVRGMAAFADHRTLNIEENGGPKRKLSFENAVIATGSRATDLPVGETETERLMGSADALELQSVPKKLLVIGGGYIGLEMGTVYAALGSRVTLVEMTSGLLPGVDRDLVRVLRNRISGLFDAVLLDTTVVETKVQKNGLRVVLEGPDGRQTRIFDRVLAAVGRRPNTEALGLENTEVRRDEHGFVRVNRRQRTNVESIFAVGDVADEPMLAHKATHQGRVAAEVIAGRQAAFEPAAIPAVVFTDPEIAWAGLTETEAKNSRIDYAASRFPWAASGRAATLGRSDGMTKLLFDPQSERVLGVGIAGAGAGELIAEGVLAIEMGANATDIGLSIHTHPTLSETIMEAAEGLHGTATSYHRPRKKKT